MQQIFNFVIVAVFVGSLAIVGNSQASLKEGDTIYANAFYGGCVKATVLKTDPAYYVRVEEGGYVGKELMYSASRLGECKQTEPATAGNVGGGGNGGGPRRRRWRHYAGRCTG